MLEKANTYVEEKKDTVKKRWYPRFHIAPEIGWCNDPNGFSEFGGAYHLFYQFYPYEPKWGPMHWGHVRSRDLVHWERLPAALAPDAPYDAGGCFSGSALERDGQLCLLYTGHVDVKKVRGEPDRIESQALATSQDGVHFEKYGKNPVITLPEGISTGEDRHFRDPALWERDGRYYVVVGAQTAKETGEILLFTSENLTDWSFVGVMAAAEGNEGFMWECPNFVEVDGHEAIVMSPQGIREEGWRYRNLHQSVLMPGHLDYKTGRFSRESFQLLDYGFDFYAPQVLQKKDGRNIFIGWLNMWEGAHCEQPNGWCGQMTVPREILWRDGRFVTPPVPEILSLREQEMAFMDSTLAAEETLSLPEETGEILLCLDCKDAAIFSLSLWDGEGELTTLSYDKGEGLLRLTRPDYKKGTGREERVAPCEGGTLSLRMFLDRSSLEIFVNDGEAVLSERIYPRDTARSIHIAGRGSVSMKNARFYTLGSIFEA